MNDEIKGMLQAIIGRLDEQGAEMKAMREEMKAIRKEMATKEDIRRLETQIGDISESTNYLVKKSAYQEDRIKSLERRVP
jgi:predicted nuclease with TOPRIM domain